MNRITGALLILLLFCSVSLASGPVVIVNKNVNCDNLDCKTLRNIFLGKERFWEGGGQVFPAALENGPVHKKFLDLYILKTPLQFTTHWKRMAFTGNPLAINLFKTERQLMEYVSQQEGAIGYVGEQTLTGGVKPLSIKQ